MSNRGRGGDAHVSVNGRDVNIRVETADEHKAVGPVNLPGVKLPENTAPVRTQQDQQMRESLASSDNTFAKPTQIVNQLGIREGHRVADFGVGSGAYIVPLARLVGSSGRVYAVDVQRDLLTRVQNTAVQNGVDNVEIVWGNVEDVGGTSIADETLDVALLSNTLFQLDDRIGAVQEVWRTLKPGGALAVVDWSESYGGMGPPPESVVTRAEAVVLCTDNGFAHRKDFPAGEHHFGLLFVKVAEGELAEDAVSASQERDKDFIDRTIAQELV